MKPQRCHYSGFTLVELLVVIAIIAILAAVLSVSASAAINAAKRAKAQNQAAQIQTAIVNYYTEYGVYPLPAGYASTSGDLLEGLNGTVDPNQQTLFFALCGNIDAAQPGAPANNINGVSNTRNIPFLTPKKSDVDTNGVMVNPFSSGTTYYYFSIAIDADYSGVLGDTGNVLTSMPDFTKWTNNNNYPALQNGITQGSAVWTCCDPANLGAPVGAWTASKTPSDWVHTY
jgi:prepilin-type N-terminal cleavage/methylation domain-containing protein